MSKTLILDNGAYTIKAGYAHSDDHASVFPNCVSKGKVDKRTFVADELSQCRDFSGMYFKYAFDKGYLTNWELEREVWESVFRSLRCDPTQTTLLLTEPCFNLPNIQQTYDEIVFEEFEFSSYRRSTAPSLSSYYTNDPPPVTMVPECALVVDSGYSFTHVVPVLRRKPIWKSVKRITVGGKLLTNHLKEIVSFRQWNMMDETYVMNEVKETCCYVSQSFDEDMLTSRKPARDNPIVQEYVLPDFSMKKEGRVRKADDQTSEDDQILVMNNERFTVPETLFHPSDIGVDQAGLPEAIVQAIDTCDPDLQGMFYSNIILTGGNARFPGFKERLYGELRKLAPTSYDINITLPTDPTTCAFEGGRTWVKGDPDGFRRACVTRAQYLEHGSD
ncbi:Actin- protein 6, partial [Rhizophlyctis rosea]